MNQATLQNEEFHYNKNYINKLLDQDMGPNHYILVYVVLLYVADIVFILDHYSVHKYKA